MSKIKNKQNKHSVFLSYSNDVKEDFAFPLAKLIEYFGVNVWLDHWEICTGDSLQQKIIQGIQKTDAFVLILSKYSLTSPWVKKELELANVKKLEYGNKILPLVVGDVKIPFELKDTVCIRCNKIDSHIAFLLIRGLYKNENEEWMKAKDFVLRKIISDFCTFFSRAEDVVLPGAIIMKQYFYEDIYSSLKEILGENHAIFFKKIILDEDGKLVNGWGASVTFTERLLYEFVMSEAIRWEGPGEASSLYTVMPNCNDIIRDNWEHWLR